MKIVVFILVAISIYLMLTTIAKYLIPKTCDDFLSQQSAQKAFENGMTKLDGDHDGIACEGLK